VKTDDQAFTEWVLDEIRFDAGALGKVFTKQDFGELCETYLGPDLRGNSLLDLDGSVSRVRQKRDELKAVFKSIGWEAHRVKAWLTEFLSPQNIAKFESWDEVSAALRRKAVEEREKMGWSATPYEIP
jgi:hypothetical protein